MSNDWPGEFEPCDVDYTHADEMSEDGTTVTNDHGIRWAIGETADEWLTYEGDVPYRW